MTEIYTYTPDMTRPSCPRCGAAVEQETVTPETPWLGTCQVGHAHTFQLESDATGITAFRGSAGDLVRTFGARLIGQRIVTERKATYPGGLAEITQLTPDANAPEICLMVQHCATGEVVGIFEDERVKTVS